MQLVSSSLPQTAPVPLFINGKYTGQVVVSILKDPKSSAVSIKVIGQRIKLETFQGSYSARLQSVFGHERITPRDEVKDLIEIFGSRTGMSLYGRCSPEDREKIQNRIKKDASRPFHGDLFTGFAVVDKQTEKIIGRISLGSGYEPGESQSGLIINESYRNKGYGKEAICLATALAHVFYRNKYPVGDNGKKSPVTRFTVTALDSNTRSVALIKKLGFKYMRPLSEKENYSPEPRTLYGIQGIEVFDKLKRLIDMSKFNCTVHPTIGSARECKDVKTQ